MGSRHDQQLVARLWNAGKSLSQIADKIEGVSRSAIGGLIHRMRKEGFTLVHRSSANNNPRPKRRGFDAVFQGKSLEELTDVERRRVKGLSRRDAPSTQPRRKKQAPKAAKPACREGKTNPPPLPALLHQPLRIPFLETREGQCRWVLDDGTCCGHPIVVASWCLHHARICLQPMHY